MRRIAAAIALAGSLGAQTPKHRAILISFDGFSEQRARQFSDSASAPALWSILQSGACAEASRPAFPSVTPTGHAAIFTGAYSNVNGISAHANGALPLSQTTILDQVDGFRTPSLRAEPIWISAARQGLRVFSHMGTQSPGAPGYPDTGTTPDPTLAAARARAASTLAKPTIGAINVYNDLVTDARVFRAPGVATRPATGWKNLSTLGTMRVAPRELSWAFGDAGDSLHAIVYWTNAGGAAVVSSTRDVSRGVIARLAPTDTTPPRGRSFARYFSPPLRIDLGRGRRTFVFFRLWELSSDLTQFLLYASEARVIQGNRPEVATQYDAAVGGMIGNGSDMLLERGVLGLIRAKGGDGIPEFRYLETAELLTKQYMRGTAWGWKTYHPDLLVDYLPQPDEALHTWLGYADPAAPGVSPDARWFDSEMLKRAYMLVDSRIAQLRALARESRSTVLFITGEHGMRPTWLTFRPNVVLRAAGLVAIDQAGKIDLSRTRAAATPGSWISVNRTTRRGGIVPPDRASGVLDEVEAALRAVRDSAGNPVVTSIWRAGTPAGDSLGLGGVAGGDLYYGLAPGIYANAGVNGAAISPAPFPKGEHGFPSVDRDMQPLFCAIGGDAVAHRFGMVRAIDIAPTVSEWLGVQPPADATGWSVLKEIVRR